MLHHPAHRLDAFYDRRMVIRSVLADWAGMLSPRDMRRIGDDPRAQFLASVALDNGSPEPRSLAEARLFHARILIRVRACQIAGRSGLAKTILKRASVYSKTRKPWRKIVAAALPMKRNEEAA